MNVYQFAANKLDFPVTQEDVEGVLQRKLSQELRALPFEEFVDEYGDEVFQDIRRVNLQGEL
ncbi:hypothetical protein [Ktedonobacter racemifer]|uniref:hypothetical protein n=1 Tax=Ktedonobacter racemifer TaxID=363277 RepID=UPI00031EC8DC|nr:hypothetical protein [Ktedonobacter racemifer]